MLTVTLHVRSPPKVPVLPVMAALKLVETALNSADRVFGPFIVTWVATLFAFNTGPLPLVKPHAVNTYPLLLAVAIRLGVDPAANQLPEAGVLLPPAPAFSVN